jgi:hypothetical protein
LPGERQIVRAIDHRFALRRPALPSAPDKKSFSSASSPSFACKVFTSIAGAAASDFASDPNTPAAPLKKLAAPLRDLVGVDVELLRQIDQRLLALGSRAVVPANASRHIRSCSRQSCRVQAENPPTPGVHISRASRFIPGILPEPISGLFYISHFFINQ